MHFDTRVVLAAFAATAAIGAAHAQRAMITIHADQPGSKIDRHIYGQFAEHLGHGIYEGVWVGEHSAIPNERGFRSDVIAALRQLKVPVVRWPGGCFADEYHWRDGIGPRDRRPVTVNTNWGGVSETNQMVNVLQAMILTDGPKMVLTPTYHVFSMFKPFQDATLLATEIQAPNYNLGAMNVPALSVSAARSASGAIVVALVNLDPHRTLSVSGELAGFTAHKVSGNILSAAEMDARNTFEAPHVVEPKMFGDAHLTGGHLTVSLPPKSVVVLNLQ